MKQTNRIPAKVWPLLAVSSLVLLPACERQDELTRLRAENEALKSASAPQSSPRNSEDEKAILTALRKLSAAVNSGVSFAAYSDLLIQNVVEIEPRLTDAPDGPFRENAAASVKAFKDAKDFWTKMAGGRSSAVFTHEEKAQFTSYKLHWLNGNEETVESGTMVNQPSFKANISIIWEEGDRRLKLAEEAAKNNH